MSREILVFALVISFTVGLANGQDTKKPPRAKVVPHGVGSDKAKGEEPHVSAPRRPSPAKTPMWTTRPAPPRPKATERKREVIRLANAPAAEVAKTIGDMIRGELEIGMNPEDIFVIVPETVGNSLVISAASQTVEEIVALVKELDARPSMVAVRVLMAEIISEGKTSDDVILDDLSAFVEDDSADAKKDDSTIVLASRQAALAMVKKLAGRKEVEILARTQIATLDSQSAFVQVGERAPPAGAAWVDKPGGGGNESVGLMVGVTPRVSPDGMVTMEIDFEKSDLADAADGEASERIKTVRVQTTVSVPDGWTIILGGLIAESGNQKRELLMVVTPYIIQ